MPGIKKTQLNLAILKLNTLSFLIDFSKSDLLCFYSTVTILDNKTCCAYMVIVSGASYSFIDEYFV
jgi:hypothetical protein